MPDTQDLAAVEALLEERNAIAGWLARLEEQGSDVPQAVLDRVRQDYRKRLDGLTDQLRQHANTIGSRLADDRSEAQALMERARRARESLAEVELRHGVGEYDDERFESERQRHVDVAVDVRIGVLNGCRAGRRVRNVVLWPRRFCAVVDVPSDRFIGVRG